VFVFLSARSEEEASCLLRELFSNEVTCVTFSSRVLDFLQICAATAPMTKTLRNYYRCCFIQTS